MMHPSILLLAGLLMTETPDTLKALTVVADRSIVVSRTDTIPITHQKGVTELLFQSPSAFVSDNGGPAGLKTLSLRGMGSPHTAIYVDGLRVGNVQSGQGDLGSLGLENFSAAVIDYAQNSMSFTTARPTFSYGRIAGGNAGFSVGSFGTFIPSARIGWKLSDKLILSANAAGIFSKGNFGYGDGLTRENNDLKEGRGGVDLFGQMCEGEWHAKAWFNSANRGTPGQVSQPSADRQRDRNIFVQGLVRKQFSSLYHLTASAKCSYDDIFYSSSWGDSRYGQTELQFNSNHRFRINRRLVLSITADVVWNGLESTDYEQHRFSATAALSATLQVERLKADVAVQYDAVMDKGQKKRNIFSPSADLRFMAFDGLDIVAFARRICRVPTFNELYYVGYGNPELAPEIAWMTDLGIDWKLKTGEWSIKARIDGFFNFLRNKITSAPSPDDPNIWFPYNIGKVRSAGVDALAGFDWSGRGWLASFTAKYCFQSATDRTTDSYTYGQQIAYVARHNLSLNASAAVKGWTAAADWTLRAGRYDSNGGMPDWNTLDLFFSKSFNSGKAGIPTLELSLKNVTDNRYELAGGYPMPGFSITGGVNYKF